jgi:hypothetical protein
LSNKISHRPSTTTFDFARKKPLSNESPIEKLGRGFLLPYVYQPTSQSFAENKQTASGKDINESSGHSYQPSRCNQHDKGTEKMNAVACFVDTKKPTDVRLQWSSFA